MPVATTFDRGGAVGSNSDFQAARPGVPGEPWRSGWRCVGRLVVSTPRRDKSSWLPANRDLPRSTLHSLQVEAKVGRW